MMLLPFLCAAAGLILSHRKPALFEAPALPKLCFTLFTLLSAAAVVTRFMLQERLQPVAARLMPLLAFGMCFTLGAAVYAAALQHSGSRQKLPEIGQILRITLLYFAAGAGLWLFIRLTGIGVVPDEMDWQPSGMTIQYWEIFLSLAAALILSRLIAHLPEKLKDIILFFVIWVGTAGLWVSIPTMEVLDHSYFMEITPPNNVPFPTSDSANFGVWAETVLTGLGFKTAIAYRQFLIVIIALFQALTDRDMLQTIDLLTILLALFPACMYLLGARLHSRAAGIFAAGMAMLREYNTILLAPHYMVSSAKMWLSDIPAGLCLLAAVTAAADWFQKPRSLWRCILAGCLMGLCVTVRSQFIVLTIFPALFFLFRKGLKPRQKLTYTLLFMLSVLLVIGPWFIRSKIITGDFILDDPGVHSTELARRWNDDVNNKVTREPGESDAEYAARNKQHMVDFFLEKPLYVVQFIASHFTANEIYALSALPWGTDPSLGLSDVTNTDFHDIEGRLWAGRNIPVVMLFIAFIALGMAACWKRCGWAGLLPFFMCSLYLGSTAAARYSGWRFALPGDWFYYFYFAVGAAELIRQAAGAVGKESLIPVSAPALDTDPMPVRKGAIAAILVIFLICGAAPALVGLLPDRVRMQSDAENRAALAQLDDPEITELLQRDDLVVLNGRMLYPRFFYAGQGLSSGHPWPPYQVRDYSRLGFVLLNTENHDVILPLGGSPDPLPQAGDVYVIGTEEGTLFHAAAVVIAETGSVIRE